MGQTPSTILQIGLLILVVLPGVTFQFLRERWRGPVPGERDLGERVLRAVTASVVLDAVYAIIAGPSLVRVVRGTDASGWHGLVQQPRLAGALALLLFVAAPAAAAGGLSWRERRRQRTQYHPTPTAWDHMFRDRSPCFVRARLKDGSWVGGWYGPRSYATSYPQPAELFLESAWRMNPDGSFDRRISNTAGLHVRADDTDVLEFLDPATPSPEE